MAATAALGPTAALGHRVLREVPALAPVTVHRAHKEGEEARGGKPAPAAMEVAEVTRGISSFAP